MRQIIKKIPGVVRLRDFVKKSLERVLLLCKPTAVVFDDIYKNNKWGSDESVSGPGSSLDQTKVVRRVVASILKKYNIKTILDVPCGDFNWMSHVDLTGVDYIGGDIVADLIGRNKEKYKRDGVDFFVIDITKDELCSVDLVVCRDCLMHLSNAQVLRALKNICKTKSRFLLTTGFANTVQNSDIAHGQWRPINLLAPPFSLGVPLEVVSEELKENDGVYSDKSLMLWSVDAIREKVGV